MLLASPSFLGSCLFYLWVVEEGVGGGGGNVLSDAIFGPPDPPNTHNSVATATILARPKSIRVSPDIAILEFLDHKFYSTDGYVAQNNRLFRFFRI